MDQTWDPPVVPLEKEKANGAFFGYRSQGGRGGWYLSPWHLVGRTRDGSTLEPTSTFLGKRGKSNGALSYRSQNLKPPSHTVHPR